LHEQAADSTPDIDHASGQFAMFTRLMLQQMVILAQKHAAERRRAAEQMAARAEDERRAFAARQLAEQKMVETRLNSLRKAGFNNATRGEIAAAVRDAAAWAPDSAVARAALDELNTHVHQRFGVRIDLETGEVVADAPVQLIEAMGAAELDRAADARMRRAQDRMVEMVGGIEGLDESKKQDLYAEIDQWAQNPSSARLDKVTAALKESGVDEQVRYRIQFVAHYLGEQHQVVPMDDLGKSASTHAMLPLRKLAAPLVDPGEEVKPRVDDLLSSYQARLRQGMDTTETTRKLGEAIAVMTPEDQATARARGVAIRANPATTQQKIWPEHVDRDALAGAVRMYAVLAPQAERQAVAADDLDAATAVQLQEKAAVHRRRIERAIKDGKGLHELERDQLASVLRDVEAGRTQVPELLFADDRSAAAVDSDRADQIAHDTATYHRRQLDAILDSNTVPDSARKDLADDISKVFHAQTQVAAGRWSLGDYEQRGLDAQLGAKLTAAGAPEALRNRVRNHLEYAAGESTVAGKQAQRIADQWSQRRDNVAAARSAAKVGHDSPQRRAGMEATLRAAGLSEETVAQRMAADAGRAVPAANAVANTPGQSRKPRTTQQGAGVRRTHHRRGERGYGK
ncbi:hypothetical protein ACFQZZ_33250, partial [Nocardia sp. GCM10030253]